MSGGRVKLKIQGELKFGAWSCGRLGKATAVVERWKTTETVAIVCRGCVFLPFQR
jgi:hypothetical protein